MLTEEEKYKSRNFNLAGIALMTPLGKIIIEPIEVFTSLGFWEFTFYLAFSILLFLLGFILIDKGRDILSKRG